MFDGVKRVLIIMNGPTTARLNWDLINEELKNNEVGIIAKFVINIVKIVS